MFDRKTPSAHAAMLAATISIVAASTAWAGECPAGKTGNNPLAGAPTAPVGVAEHELASIDLATSAACACGTWRSSPAASCRCIRTPIGPR